MTDERQEFDMEREDLPLGFSFALAQNPGAMKVFSNLSETRKAEVLRKAHSVSSKREMQSLVNSLAASPRVGESSEFNTAAF